MADRVAFYNGIQNSPANDVDLEPPRTRIAVACNRCRRRKIKCSGSIDAGSCDACIRANDAECVFADRPQQQSAHQQHLPQHISGAGYSIGSIIPASPVQMQPLGTSSRSSSLPSQVGSMPRVITGSERHAPIRTMSGTSRGSISSLSGYSHSQVDGRISPFAVSPSSSKRQSLSSNSHPYQRPGSAGYRKNSGDPIGSNLVRYSQSLIQSQSQQLSGRAQSRVPSVTAPTSIPVGYTQALPYQLQPSDPPVPIFRRPDYDHAASYTSGDMSGPLDYNPAVLGRECQTDQSFYSPMYDSPMYSVSTPDLLSSDSVSTMDSRSSAGLSLDHSVYRQMPYVNQPLGQSQMMQIPSQPYDLASASLCYDPSQWTPGVDKLDKQYMEFTNFSPSAVEYPNIQ